MTVPCLWEHAASSGSVRKTFRTEHLIPTLIACAQHLNPPGTADRARPTARLGTAVGATGVHAGLWLVAAPVAIALTSLEAVLAATVILTALYASPLLSERAFRMLPWTRQPSSASIPAAWPERAWVPVRAVLVETEEMT